MTRARVLCGGLLVFALSGAASAAITPLYEPFNYIAGQRLSEPPIAGTPATSTGQVNDNQTVTTADDRTWASAGGTASTDWPLVASGNLATLAGMLAGPTSGSNSASWGGQGGSSRIAVGSVASGEAAYYSLMLNITNIASSQLRPYTEPSTNQNHNWLFSFTSSAGAATSAPGVGGARVYARQGPLVEGVATTYELGFTKNSVLNSDITWENVFRSPNEPVLIVAKYGVVTGTNNDEAALWINPTSFGGADPGGSLTNATGNDVGVASFLIRQTGATAGASNGSVVIDELRVGGTYASVTPTPEPASLSLVAMAGVALLARRRRA